MPATTAAVISAISFYEALGAATWWGAGLWIVGGTVASYEVANLLSSSSDVSDSNPLNAGLSGGEKVNTRSSQTSLKVIYGQRKVGGNDVYIATAGDAGDRDLWLVQVLAEGECEGIAQDDDGHDLVFFGDKQAYLYPSDKYEYFFHSGSDSQTVDSHLSAVDPAWTDPLRNTTYIVWHLIYDRDVWMGVPIRTVVLKGRKLYDFRDESTAYSTNPVLALYDYMTDDEYGLGIDVSRIDTTSWATVANYCDTNGIELNMSLYNLSAYDAIAQMLLPFHGELYWWNDKYYLRYKDLASESIAMNLTDSHIVQDESGKALIRMTQPGMAETLDGVKVSFIDRDKGYTSDSVIVGESQGNIKNITLAGVTDRQQASLIGLYILERGQLNRKVSGTFRGDCSQLDVGDLVSLTTESLGLEDQTMRVVESAIRSDNLVDLVLEYEDEDLYDQEYNVNPEDTYTCSLPDPTDPPPGVSNATIEEEQYYYRLRTFTRLKISFDQPDGYPWYDHVEVWILDGSTWKYLYDVNTDFNIDPVQEGDVYDIRLRVVNIWGVKQSEDDAYRLSWTVEGKTEKPSSLDALQVIVNQNTVNLYSDRVSDPDVEVYEFRLGDTWTSGIFLGALRNPNMSLSGVKPGSFTFWCNTLANNGNYGEVPVSASVSLADPPDGWSVAYSYTDDYSGGTHDNTEQTTYASEYYLKCSHTGGVLTGTYLSPVYDLGSSGRYLVYLTTEYVVAGEGMTWEDKFPSPTTWREGGAIDQKWDEIFNITEGSQVHISIKYGDDTSLSNTVERMEILSSIITGRYFQVQIEIDDPGMNVYTLVKHNTLKFCQVT